MDHKKINLERIKLSGRTFDPDSPNYISHGSRRDISDIKPHKPVNNYPVKTAVVDTTIVQPQKPKVYDDIDSLFPLPVEKPTHHHQVAEPVKKEEKSNFKWSSLIILVSSFALLGYSFLNKARYHHVYIIVLILNCLIVLGIFAKGKVPKWTIIIYQLPVLLASLAIAALFTYNFINTNHIYQQNYQKIKNDSSSLSFQQKQDLATYQYTIIFNRNSYKSQSKVFYSLVGLQIVQSIVTGIVLIKRD